MIRVITVRFTLCFLSSSFSTEIAVIKLYRYIGARQCQASPGIFFNYFTSGAVVKL
jgi:hypothetical protein